MVDTDDLKVSFLSEYLELYRDMLPKHVVFELRNRWFPVRSDKLGVRKTTSMELYDYDRELLDMIPTSSILRTQSEKIRYVMRLGIIAYNYGWGHQLPFAQDVIENVLKLAPGEFEEMLTHDIDQLVGWNKKERSGGSKD